MNELKRCAIYTRKSVEEGLDAEFNTLEAQRKYCEAYVADQPGWLALPERYDDGGYSGGNMMDYNIIHFSWTTPKTFCS